MFKKKGPYKTTNIITTVIIEIVSQYEYFSLIIYFKLFFIKKYSKSIKRGCELLLAITRTGFKNKKV